MSNIEHPEQVSQVTPSELAELRRKAAVADWLLSHNSVEHGWHGNSENHTLNVTLYFGDFDPQHLVRQDDYGNAKLSLEDIEEVLQQVPA